jgi:hypothetical protein
MPRPNPDAPQRRKRRRATTPGLEGTWGRSKQEGARKNQRRRFNRRVRLFVLLLVVCLAVLVTGFVLRDSFSAGSQRSVAGSAEPPPIEVLPPPESPQEKSTAAIALLDEFFKISDPSRRLHLVFDSVDQTDAFLDYYGRIGRRDPAGIRDRKVTAILDKGREILIVTFKDEQNRQWAAPVEWNVNGYRLHWGSMTGYGEVPWDRFLAERSPNTVTMRVNIYRPDSEPSTFVPEGHAFVLITHPELGKPLGALLSNAPSLEPLLKLPKNTDIPAKVIMQWRNFGPSGEWPVVSELVHRNWIR